MIYDLGGGSVGAAAAAAGGGAPGPIPIGYYNGLASAHQYAHHPHAHTMLPHAAYYGAGAPAEAQWPSSAVRVVHPGMVGKPLSASGGGRPQHARKSSVIPASAAQVAAFRPGGEEYANGGYYRGSTKDEEEAMYAAYDPTYLAYANAQHQHGSAAGAYDYSQQAYAEDDPHAAYYHPHM